MGGRSWHCSVAWEPDLDAALRRAQEETFQDGTYGREDEEDEEDEGARPASIEEACARYDFDGTASVLDILTLERFSIARHEESPRSAHTTR